LLEHLGVDSANERASLTDAMRDGAICSGIRELTSFEDQFAALATLFPATKGKSPEQRVAAEISGRFGKLPGDVFFINVLGENHTGGFIAYLRLIRELRSHQIATNFFDHSRTVIADRVSQMRAPYVYRLTQLLADVFASIGLPEEYERARADVIATSLLPASLVNVS
jgi:hypothetical protein